MAKTIKITDKRYPALLKETAGAPAQLYYKGKWEADLFKNCLAVVGSRKITGYGRQAVKLLVGDCARAGITIVSGFMYGVDAAAHQMAVEAGGRTIAVMPCGIDCIHPEHQEKLYHEIVATGGLILSEYAGAALPQQWTYPQRNRIVAGLSQAALVVEAAYKSGSLITADLARRFKRGLLAVPGPITSTVSQGTLQLIREGAVMVTRSEDILNIFGIEARIGGSGIVGLEGLPQRVLECLGREPLRVDDLAYALKVSVARISTALSLLQLENKVHDDYGKYSLNLAEVKHGN